ncbi:MAG: Fe-S-containing protein [Bacilli bacterium]|nr:Fe-S-containing protein [Bacilli bacterium]
MCQNCGNRYHIDKLGLERGGCNPIPISGSEREDSGGNIIIPAELLEEMAPRFKNLAL